MDFTIECHYNAHLSPGADQLHTVLTVTARDALDAAERPDAKRVFGYLVDVSGSMSGGRLLQAKLALRRQLDLLSPTDWVFVVSFNGEAKLLVPLLQVSELSMGRVHQVVQEMSADGGTAMSGALAVALREFERAGPCLAYAQLVTDGQNDMNDRDRLMQTLQKCRGVFQCDAWGVGEDWEPAQLREIAHALLGQADAVPEPQQLDAMFRRAQRRAASRAISAVQLRLQAPRSVRVVSVRQQSPEILDLTDSMVPSTDGREWIVPLGAWAPETRDYYVVCRLEPQDDGEEVMAFRARIGLDDMGTQRLVEGPRVVATWTSDTSLSTRIDSQVAHATGQQELAESIREGLEAKGRGDVDQATSLLGRAARLAHASGNDEVTRRLSKVVDIVSAERGTVRLKSGSTKSADKELDLGGTHTVRRRASAAAAPVIAIGR